jgi:NADP-dependent 3-hydroxy acid dehydrogenase YdfG
LGISARMFSLAQKTALVLGGSSGIGRALASVLADAGADVIVSARRQDLVDSTATEIHAKGRQTIRAVADVRDRQPLANLRDTIPFGLQFTGGET